MDDTMDISGLVSDWSKNLSDLGAGLSGLGVGVASGVGAIKGVLGTQGGSNVVTPVNSQAGSGLEKAGGAPDPLVTGSLAERLGQKIGVGANTIIAFAIVLGVVVAYGAFRLIKKAF